MFTCISFFLDVVIYFLNQFKVGMPRISFFHLRAQWMNLGILLDAAKTLSSAPKYMVLLFRYFGLLYMKMFLITQVIDSSSGGIQAK